MTLLPRSSLAVETCCAQGIHMSLYMWQPIHPCSPIQKLAHSSAYHFQRDCADVVNSCNNVLCSTQSVRDATDSYMTPVKNKATRHQPKLCLPEKIPQCSVTNAWLLLPDSKKMQRPPHPPYSSLPLVTCYSHLTRNRWDQGESTCHCQMVCSSMI